MRPTPNELIAGIRQLLKERVGSSLSSADAVDALRKVMAVLRDVDWNEAGFALQAENRRLLDLLAEIGGWIAGQGARALAFEAVADRIRTYRERDAKTESFEAAVDLNRACRRVLADFVDMLSDAASDAASHAERNEWRARLVGVLAEIAADATAVTRHTKNRDG